MIAEEIKKYYSEWWENPRDIRNVVFEGLNEYVRRYIEWFRRTLNNH